jgi:hypothetical protein
LLTGLKDRKRKPEKRRRKRENTSTRVATDAYFKGKTEISAL